MITEVGARILKLMGVQRSGHMAAAKAKTINLLLHEGDLSGVISMEDSSWNSGELYSAPRESVSELLETDACNKYGVYLLLSKDKVYVGQSSDLSKRINQHIVGKDWWESVVILTTQSDSLTHTDIDYLESVLIEKAKSIGKLDCDNKNKGNNPKVDKFREVFLGQYLDEALFLMQLIGITVFSDSKVGNTLLNTIDIKTRLALGKRAKTEALSFLNDKGIAINNKATYASLSDDKTEFWANPKIYLLNADWEIVLNDNKKLELVIMRIPANTLSLATENESGLLVRSDKKDQIDLKLNASSLVDKRSKIDFSSFVLKRVSY